MQFYPYCSVITSHEFLEYRKQIKEIFPSEDPAVYYRPSITKTLKKSNASYVPAGGRLYDRYKNVLKQYRMLDKAFNTTTDKVDIELSDGNRTYLHIILVDS